MIPRPSQQRGHLQSGSTKPQQIFFERRTVEHPRFGLTRRVAHDHVIHLRAELRYQRVDVGENFQIVAREKQHRDPSCAGSEGLGEADHLPTV
jgi:hypothetical protein